MRIHSLLLSCCLGVPLCCIADTPAPVHVVIGKPLTPITDVLASLAKQTGQTILADDTAVAPVNVADLQAPTLDAMLDGLKALDAGLTWHKVYLPANAPLPTGNGLSAQVRALQAITADSLVIADPGKAVSLSHVTAEDVATLSSRRLVYLVTDEAVRASRAAAKAAEDKPATVTPGTQVASGMQSAATAFSRMTPDEQRQALPFMFQQFQAIMQGMDPSVRAQLRQQFGGRRRGGPPGPGNGQ